jgi:uncharacterized membrane protein YjjP (DUF1212 family)
MTFVLTHGVEPDREPMYGLMFVLLLLGFSATLLVPLTRLQWQVSVPTVLLCGVGLDKLARVLARTVRRAVTGDRV